LKSTAFEYHAPTTAAEAVGLLAELGDEAKLLAGGQSLIPMPARHQQLAHGVDPRQQPGRPGWGGRIPCVGGAGGHRGPRIVGTQSNEGSLIIGDPMSDPLAGRRPGAQAAPPGGRSWSMVARAGSKLSRARIGRDSGSGSSYDQATSSTLAPSTTAVQYDAVPL